MYQNRKKSTGRKLALATKLRWRYGDVNDIHSSKVFLLLSSLMFIILFYNLIINITSLSFIDGENFKLLPCCIQELRA